MTDSKNTLTIGANDFVRRQTANSEFTHFDGTWERVVQLALENFAQAKDGYRPGVCLVPVPAEGFHTGVVALVEGDRLEGAYRARREGEEPRKDVRVVREGVSKGPCVAVDVVLYRKDVLAEGNEGTTDCDWEIISVNGRVTEEDQPIHPDTLIANHFELDGGTATGMTDEKFVSDLRKSVLYWKDKAILAP
jgi:hypothetical protein